MNLARYVSMLRKHYKSSLFVGGFMSLIACVFLRSSFNFSQEMLNFLFHSSQEYWNNMLTNRIHVILTE